MEEKDFLEKLYKDYEPKKDNLIQFLNHIQTEYGYISTEFQKQLSIDLNMPIAEIYGIITFYSRFTLTPKGKHTISICMGTACFVKGSQKIKDRLIERLDIKEGETTKDGFFSYEEQRCIGACGLAPVFTVDGKVYGKATVKMLDEVLDELEKEKAEN